VGVSVGACSSVLPGPTVASRATEGAGPSAATGVVFPRLLIGSSDQSHTILDPNLPPGPGRARPLVLPPGRWSVTTGPSSVALTPLDPVGRVTILLGTVTGATFSQSDSITLPAGEAWTGGYPACLSGSGPVIAADAGLRLWLVAPGEDPVALPNQRDNRGHCTWLDDGHAVWEQENDRLAAFDLESATTTELPANPIVRDTSSGEGRIAGITATNGLVVSPVSIDGSTVTIGPPLGHIDPEAGGRLSADGRWLIVTTSDGSSRIYRVDGDGLTSFGSLPIASDDRVEWLPSPSMAP
jgi:hypothetical protein